MILMKRAKKKRKLCPSLNDNDFVRNTERLTSISNGGSVDIMVDVKRNAEFSDLCGREKLKGKYADLSLKKRKKCFELNDDNAITKSERVDSGWTSVKRIKRSDPESAGVKENKEANYGSARIKKSRRANSDSTRIKISKGMGSELAGVERSKRLETESAEVSEGGVDAESASVESTTATTTEEPFDLNKIRAIRYQLNNTYKAKRSLFFKSDASDPLSLLIFNIPPFISPESVRIILEHRIVGGTVKEVTMKRSMIKGADPNETYRVASVRFDSEEEVEGALRRCDDKKNIICLSHIGVDVLPRGIIKYVREYRRSFVPADELQERVDSFFEVHDAKILEEKEKAKKMRNVADADGWITVTRSRFKPVPAAVVVNNKEDLLKLSKKKKRMKDSIPFYTFQLKQSKMKHLEELRQKFEEDKKKLALAKAARKFRPN